MSFAFSERVLNIIAIAVSLLCAVFGLAVFYSHYQYAEPGQSYLVITYITACLGLFFAIKLSKKPLGILSILLLLITQVYSGNKFAWREDYISQAQQGKPFFLEEFIDHYPTYEEYKFSFLGDPDWVRFNEQCVQPALTRQAILPRCSSPDMIMRFYYIDIMQAMQTYFERMKSTAKMIESGQLTSKTAFAECIANKGCATIPLLPKGVDANNLDPSSKDYIGIRQAFWSLINDKEMSKEACALTPLCLALVNMKVFDGEKISFQTE